MKKVRISIAISALWVALFIIARCGSSSTSASLSTALAGLDSLPSVASMVKGSGVNGTYANLESHSFANYPISLHVSGIPPLLTEITSAKVDTYFWNGLINTIKNTSAANITDEMRNKFYGGVTGGPGGHGTCFQAQSVGESFDRMIEAGTSMCYMRKVPKAATGVTISAGTARDLFAQTADDKVVKVAVTGDPHGDNSDVWIKVYGSGSAGANYNVDLWFCDGSTVRGYEKILINKETGVFSATHTGKDTWDGSSYVFQSTVSAALTVGADGSVVFDTSKDRTADAYFGKVGGSGSDSGVYKGRVVVNDKDWIYAKRYNKYSFTDHNNTAQTSIDKNYSISAFSGDSLKKLRFLQAAFKGYGSWGNDSHSYSGASEYQDTHYVAIASSDLKTEADTMNFSTDTFYTSLAAPTYDASAHSCSATPTHTVSINMADAAMLAVSTECEAERFRDYNMCWTSDIQAAQRKINEHY